MLLIAMAMTDRFKYTISILSFIILFCNGDTEAQIKNFDKKGRQVTRFSSAGDALDAHDGEIAFFNGIYYLYGTSYDCGFEWGNKGAPFCGFKSYSSPDMKPGRTEVFFSMPKRKFGKPVATGKPMAAFARM